MLAVAKAKGTGKQYLGDGNKKRNMLQLPINVAVWHHVKFLFFATFFVKFFAAETKKKFKKMIFCLFQQQKPYVASEKTWEKPRVPAPWVDFLKHFFFYPIKFTKSSKQTKTFYPKHFTTRWRIVKTCSQSKSRLMKEKQLLSTFI